MPKKRGGASDDEAGAAPAPSGAPKGGKKGGKKGGRGGDSDDEVADLTKAAKNLKLVDADEDEGRGKSAKGKKVRPADGSDDDAPKTNAKAPGKAGRKGGKGGEDVEDANDAPSKKGGKAGKKGRRGDSSDEEEEEPKPAPPNNSGKGAPQIDADGDDGRAAGRGSGKAAANAGAASASAAGKKKGGKKGKKGRDSDDDDDDGGAGLLAIPTLGKPGGRLRAAESSDEEPKSKPMTKKEKKAAGKGGAGPRGGKGGGRQDDSDEEEEDATQQDDAGGAEVEVAAPGPAALAPVPAPPAPTPAPQAAVPAPLVEDDGDLAFASKKKKKVKAKAAEEDESVGLVSADAAPPAPPAVPAAGEGEGDGEGADASLAKKKKKKKAVFQDEAEQDGEGAAPGGSNAVVGAGGGDDPVSPPVPERKEKKEKKDKRKGKEEEGEGELMFFGEASMGVGRDVGDGQDLSGYTGFDGAGEPVGLDGEPVEEQLAKALVKRQREVDLSNRERRLVTAYDEVRAARGPVKVGGSLHDEGDEMGLSSFSLSQAGKMAGAGGEASTVNENAKDIVIEKFTISAYKKVLFENASLRIAHGRRYGLVGPNGQGKSTLLKHMAAKELAIPGRIDMLYVEQEVVADDTPAIQAVLKADKKRAGLLNEETRILSELDAADAAEEKGSRAGRLTEVERTQREERLNAVYEELTAMKAEAAESNARKILSGLGFTTEMQERPTRQFSGGWRMRISLARALFMQPDLLLLDEPTNHLDLNAVIWLEDYLSRWKNTLLIVSHDQDFLSAVVTDIMHLEEKKLFYYKGNYDDFKGMHKQKLEKQQKDWEQQQKDLRASKAKGKTSKEAEAAAKAKAKRDAGKNETKATKAAKQSNVGEAEQEAGSSSSMILRPREYTVSFEFTDPSELAPPVLSVSNASFRYGPKYPVLFENLNFGIDQSSRVAIVGPNGVGKSTLLNLLIGELTPTDGDVQRNRFLRVGKYSQHFLDVLPMDKSPVEFLQGHFSDLTYQDARALLGRFGLEGHAHTIAARDLSGGQKARVVFSHLCMSSPHIMVLDEPTNNLDIESIDALADALRVYQGGVVLVSHDARLIRNADCRLWVCDKQTVDVFDGDIDDYRLSLIEHIHADEEKLEEMMERMRAEEEERRMAAARDRARKIKALKEEAAKAAKAALAAPA